MILVEPQLKAVQRAKELLDSTQQNLNESVQAARLAGATWQEIGDILNISKQAAFQKFQEPMSPTNDKQNFSTIEADLLAKTKDLFAALTQQDFEKVHANMTYTTARLLSKRKISKVWEQVLAACGTYRQVAHSSVSFDSAQKGFVLTYRLEHAHGQPVGQVAFNARRQIIGWVIFTDDSAQLPW